MIGLLAFVASEVSAYTVILVGGTRNHTYYKVICNRTKTECRGRGNNPCLIQFNPDGNIHIAYNDILDQVLRRYDNGESKGTFVYDESIPVSWSENDLKELVVDIDDSKYADQKE